MLFESVLTRFEVVLARFGAVLMHFCAHRTFAKRLPKWQEKPDARITELV